MTAVDTPPEQGAVAPVARTSSRRVLVVVADQAVNSVTNVVLVLVVAAAVPLTRFGLFAAAAVAIQLGQNAGLSALGDRLLQADPARRAARFATGRLLLRRALATGLAVAALGTVWLGPSPWLVAAALLPTLAGIDYWRIHTIARGRATVALVLDVVFGLLQIAAVLVWWTSGTPFGIAGAVAAWMAAALVANGVSTLPWFRDEQRVRLVRRDPVSAALSLRYGLEVTAVNGAGQIAQLLVTLELGLAFSGTLRAAQVPFGVMIVVVASVRAVLIPRMAAADAAQARRTAQVAAAATVVTAAALTALTAVVAAVAPLRFLVGGVHLEPGFVAGLGCGYAAIAVATVQTYHLRARHRDREVTAGRVALVVVLALGTLAAMLTRSPGVFLAALALSWTASSVVMLGFARRRTAARLTV